MMTSMDRPHFLPEPYISSTPCLGFIILNSPSGPHQTQMECDLWHVCPSCHPAFLSYLRALLAVVVIRLVSLLFVTHRTSACFQAPPSLTVSQSLKSAHILLRLMPSNILVCFCRFNYMNCFAQCLLTLFSLCGVRLSVLFSHRFVSRPTAQKLYPHILSLCSVQEILNK